ncbi:hypothetical protein CHGG_04470 [Chaetomium globosum CBS 148.51]|uniref:Clr5 domain-containing protein n=1 Tax=Chaetomium globosum (strain ATCC 6205 / CBS 148.51 / DSM 1962 / NBRC 6347 / NRRL 1970) TaxID=306901 RepID=Q2H176_CHAGB|nr:uncharacterized protein CHGG_04470 [Chaetomium globosum CBS 148.51]EAQ87851.1 hypothetical protein CHGG_04470 [Chaetomium globosum CBS 148.51]
MDAYYGYDQSAQQTVPAAYRPSKPEDWEPYHDIIAHLYNAMNMKLKDVMSEMQMTYNFKATSGDPRYPSKWNLDTKYIKASEYMFMIKTMRERQAENPPKETRFMLRGRVVDPKDIARFEKRAQKKGTMRDGDPIECDEPVEDLVYGTPPPEDVSYHQAAYAQAYAAYQYDPSAEYSYSY